MNLLLRLTLFIIIIAAWIIAAPLCIQEQDQLNKKKGEKHANKS